MSKTAVWGANGQSLVIQHVLIIFEQLSNENKLVYKTLILDQTIYNILSQCNSKVIDCSLLVSLVVPCSLPVPLASSSSITSVSDRSVLGTL